MSFPAKLLTVASLAALLGLPAFAQQSPYVGPQTGTH
jgi:hypothetical protein